MSVVHPLCSFFGHHKCATQWIKSVLVDICELTNLRLFEVSRIDESGFASLRDLLDCFRPDVLVYSNADITRIREAGHLRGFHVVRDPRDLIVSAYFSHLHSHPLDTWRGLAEHRHRLRSLGKTEGLLLEMEFSRRVLEEMRDWDYSSPDVLEIRMEDLVEAPELHFARVIEHVGLTSLPDVTRTERLSSAVHIVLSRIRRRARGLISHRLRASDGDCDLHERVAARWWGGKDPYRLYPLDSVWARGLRLRNFPMDHLPAIVERHRFSTKADRRNRGHEDPRHHYRKGIAGDWRNHFNEVHIEAFRRRHNDVLLKLGYETDPHWT